MADLLSSLVQTGGSQKHGNSSQESFHSAGSHPPSPKQIAPDAHASALQTAGLPVYSVESFLNDPQNAALLVKSTPQTTNLSRTIPPQTLEPVQLGSKTSHQVSALYNLCQSKGITPEFEIDGEADVADFGGVLRIEGFTITSDKRARSKKEMKEALAEQGVEVVKQIQAKSKGFAGRENAEKKNWVGILHEYHSKSYGPSQGPVYIQYALGSSYACTCTTPDHLERPFGSPTDPFPSKKAAQINSAREAVEFLISEGKLNADGTTKARKKAELGLGTAIKVDGQGLKIGKGTTYAQKVNDACPVLGLQHPTYHLAPVSPDAPNMLSGYGSFPNQPGSPPRIGEVRNVYGKKTAREEVARGVWEFLKDLAKKRGLENLGEERE